MRRVAAIALLASFMAAGHAQAQRANCIVPELGLHLAGVGAVDCGIANASKSRQQNRLLKCARKALDRKQPVRFGTGYFGIDSFGCEVIVIDAERTFWLVTFDWDLSLSDDRPKGFVGRCPAFDLDEKIFTEWGGFRLDDCVFDGAAFERAKISHP